MIKSIKRLLDWADTQRSQVYRGFVYSFFHSIFTALPVILAAYCLNLIIDASDKQATLPTSTIIYTAIAMILLLLGRFLFSYLRALAQESVGYIVTAEQRIQIGEKLKRVSLGFFQKRKTGDLVSAVTTDLSFIEMYGMKMIDTVINGYISVFTIILCLAFYHYLIALIAIVGIVLSAIFLKYLQVKSKQNAPIHQQAKEQMISATIEYLRGMQEVKAFKQQGVTKENIRKAYKLGKQINITIEKDYLLFNCLHILSLHFAAVGIVFMSAYLTLNQQLPLSTMLMMVIFSFVIFNQIEAVNNASHVLKMIDETMDKLDELSKVESIDHGGQNKKITDYNIHFRNVAFSYENREVIRNISFTIPAYSTTAIVGPSGSGKSTLCKLIARFYDINQGDIEIGGVNIKEITIDRLLENISIVFQKVYLFHDTILNNIRFGKPHATIEEVIEISKQARCHDFIMALPDGYNSMIGEGGATLSGGEKQRISIARAMLKDAPIIILDEATASIDPENEHQIQEAISALVKGKTIIMIAHRLATIENADQIIVMDDGKIAQKGTHKSLIKEEGLYKRFFQIREKVEGWSIND